MKTSQKKLFRRFLAATLLIGGPFQLAAPLLAAGTPAGTTISNTASGQYEDSNAPGVPINATSNTVSITVAEIAGISLTQTGAPTDVNGGSIQPSDVVNYNFTITNIGNDATKFFIPSTATVTGGTQGTIVYSTDGTNFVAVPAGGVTTSSIPVNGTVIVRVPVTVGAVAAGSSLSVRLGDTVPKES